ncbi:hypothetical protein ACHAPT_004703 [Fusarium lateritium]
MCKRIFTRATCAWCKKIYNNSWSDEVCAAAKKKKGKMGDCGRISPIERTSSDLFCSACPPKYRKEPVPEMKA